MSDRTMLAIFAALALAAGAAVIVPTHDSVARGTPPAGATEGLGSLSLVRAVNTRKTLDTVASQSPSGALVQNLVLQPADLVLNVEDPAKGSLRTFGLNDSGKVQADGVSDANADYGVPFAKIDAAAPERLARAVLARLHQPAGTIDSVAIVVGPTKAPIRWRLALQHIRIPDRQWVSDAHGRHVKRGF